MHAKSQLVGVVCFLMLAGLLACGSAVVLAEEDLAQTVATMLFDKDKDVRALALEQVRDGLKGAAATQRFVALLAQLPPDGQAALLTALGDRGDAASLPEIKKYVANTSPAIRAAAIRAVGALGSKDEASVLVPLLGNPDTKTDATAAILCLHGAGIPQAILAEAKQTPALRTTVFPLLVTLHATDVVGDLLAGAEDPDASVRSAAISALGQLAGPEQVADLARLILKAPTDAARREAELALATLSGRAPNPDACSEPMLNFMQTQSTENKAVLLGALGRVGGKGAMKIVLAALTDNEPAIREAGLLALCKWPDGTVANKLVEIATKGETAEQRTMALEALIRVAPLPNNRARPDTNRSDGERLKMVKKAMELSTTTDQKSRLLKRAGAVYTFDTFNFVLPYLDQPDLAESAAEAIVTIAHHKEVRHAHPAEFADALERVIKTSKNKKLVEEATRYKEDRT